MHKRIQNTSFLDLLPASISNDAGIATAARALDAPLQRLALAVPNLLLFSRLDPAPARLAPPLQRLADAAGGLKPLSEAELELLAWQFHVDFREVARTPEQLAALVRQSIPWHRIKGTPASIREALALFGYSAVIEEDGVGENWASYQLGLPQIADLNTVRHVCTIAHEMAPVRCRLWRMYSGFDHRPIIFSEGPILGDGWLSYYSGVPVQTPDGEIIVSFGSKHSVHADAYADFEMQGSFGATLHFGFLAPYLDSFTVGRSRLGDVYPRNNPFVMGSLFSILWADRQTTPRKWRGEWDARCWLDYTGFDRKLPHWRMERRAVARAQLILGEAEDGDNSRLGDINSRLGVNFVTSINAPQRLGAFRLSEHDCARNIVRIDEFFTERRGLAIAAVQPESPGTQLNAYRDDAFQSMPLHNECWTDGWNARAWRGYVAQTKIVEW